MSKGLSTFQQHLLRAVELRGSEGVSVASAAFMAEELGIYSGEGNDAERRRSIRRMVRRAMQALAERGLVVIGITKPPGGQRQHIIKPVSSPD